MARGTRIHDFGTVAEPIKLCPPQVSAYHGELASIVVYTKEDLGTPAAADSFVSKFRRVAHLICSFPESIPLCPDPYLGSRGYRSFRVKGCIALYLRSEDVVYVDHVFHQSQDYTALVMQKAK